MPLVIGDRERMYRLGHELRARGLWVAPVDYPAVPQDRICFRACVTALHTRDALDEALNILADTFVPQLLAHRAGGCRALVRQCRARLSNRRPLRRATRPERSRVFSTSISIANSDTGWH